MAVIRTLLDRCETLVTKEEDKWKEREHIKEALTRCGYPQWTISTVQTKMKTKKEDNIRKKTVEKDSNEASQHHQKVTTPSKGHNTIKRSLVRPKDKLEPQKMCEGVYSITCKNCNATYIGETKRTLGTSIKEHKEDVEKALASRPYTRSNRKI